MGPRATESRGQGRAQTESGHEEMPHPRSIDPESFEEERRLMYVAVTRARQRLLITYPVDGLPTSPQGPSPFLPPKFPWDDLGN